ncbi:CBS domain-containing protein [Prauserella flavalba]|nr:CBS domain-containing protein [Prauserella flavalba]
MTRPVVTISGKTSFKDIVAVLAEHGIGSVPVVDAQDRPIGVVSEADLLAKEDRRGAPEPPSLFTELRRWRRWNRARGRLAEDVMTRHVVTIGRDDTLGSAARRLAEGNLRRLYVVDGTGKLVGVVARRDVLSVFLQPDEELGKLVRREVLHRAMWLDPGTVTVHVKDGVVSLSGTLERRSEVDIAGNLTAAIPGVVDVRNDLRAKVDDTAATGKSF